jgi:hypothetical protein
MNPAHRARVSTLWSHIITTGKDGVTLKLQLLPCGHGCSRCPHGPYYVAWIHGAPAKYLGKSHPGRGYISRANAIKRAFRL